MLAADEVPTIEWAIRRRLDQEPGAYVFIPILAQPYAKGEWFLDADTGLHRVAGEPFIRVGVQIALGNLITLFAKFDLPDPFEHGHLLNQADEIAEQCKRVRREVFTSSLVEKSNGKLSGTGMRGNWDRYGTLMGRHG